MKKLNTQITYKIETARAVYLVTVEHLKNTYSGNPRFEARITNISYNPVPDNIAYYTAVYRFTGYFNDLDAARYIVAEHEKQLKKEV